MVNIERIETLIEKCNDANNKNMPDLSYQYGILLYGYLEGLIDGKVIKSGEFVGFMYRVPNWVFTKIVNNDDFGG